MKIRAKEHPRYANTPKALLKSWDKHPVDTSHKLRYRAEYLANDGKWYPCYTRRYNLTKRQALKKARGYALTKHEVFSTRSACLRAKEVLQAEHEALAEFTWRPDWPRHTVDFARGARVALQWVMRDPEAMEAPSKLIRTRRHE